MEVDAFAAEFKDINNNNNNNNNNNFINVSRNVAEGRSPLY